MSKVNNWPFESQFPTPKIASFNTNGLSAYDKNAIGSQRFLSCIKTIRILGENSDIILIQETHLNHNEGYLLNANFPSWKIYYNNYNSASMGCAILVSRRIHQFFNIKHEIYDIGASHSLTFTHESIQISFEVFNVYITSKLNWLLKRDTIIKFINKRTIQDYNFFAGDWNFVENLADTFTENNNYKPSDDFIKTWEKFTNKFNLQEVKQDYYTRLSIRKSKHHNSIHKLVSLPKSNNKIFSASRLDRIYISFDQAETAIIQPTTHIHNTFLHNKPPSDHLPIIISYKKQQNKNKQISIPNWVVKNKKFQKTIRVKWNSIDKGKTSAYTQMAKFHQLITKETAIFKK